MAGFDIQRIMDYLPHRYPFLLVDRVLEVESNQKLVSMKNVTMNEQFFNGHFPGNPVMPGVLVVEALAQSSAILASQGLEHVDTSNKVYLFTGIDKARFKRPVVPGDQLIFEVEIVRRIRNMWKSSGVAKVDDKVVATADMMFTFIET